MLNMLILQQAQQPLPDEDDASNLIDDTPEPDIGAFIESFNGPKTTGVN